MEDLNTRDDSGCQADCDCDCGSTNELFYWTNFEDVVLFHEKFGLEVPDHPTMLDDETYNYRLNFLREELNEFVAGYHDQDMAQMADALIDLVYVAMGTADLMGLPWQHLWDEVQVANMSKERCTDANDPRNTRKNALNVVKPEGWQPPDIQGVLDFYAPTPKA